MAVAGWSSPQMVTRYSRARASERAAAEAHSLGLGDLWLEYGVGGGLFDYRGAGDECTVPFAASAGGIAYRHAAAGSILRAVFTEIAANRDGTAIS